MAAKSVIYFAQDSLNDKYDTTVIGKARSADMVPPWFRGILQRQTEH